MTNFFSLTKKRYISDANPCIFTTPIYHPDRIMNEHDFIYMIDGIWKIGQNDESFTIKNGDILILPANNHHFGIEPCRVSTRTLYIHAEALPLDTETGGDIFLPSLIKTNENGNVKKYFEKIIFAKAKDDDLMASTYFDALLYELFFCSGETSKNNLADRIREMIVHSDTILRNSEIADALNISVKTAENSFKKAYGTTIHQYILSEKIAKAKFQIFNFPDIKLYEIAENLGFYNEFHLSKVFKKIVGVSPAQYKREKSQGKLP